MSRQRDQAGLSSTEVIIMAAIMSVLMIMVTESMNTLSGVRSEQRTLFRLGDVGDKVARRIERDVDVAARVFSDTVEDTDYLRAMDLGFDLLASGRRLPRLTTHGYFEPDPPGVSETGNVLFVARRVPRVAVHYDLSTEYHVQCLQFTVTSTIDTDGHLDLMRWNSDLVVDYWDVAEIANALARVDVGQQLYENGVRFAWDTTAARATGLYELTSAGGLIQLATDRLITGKMDDSSRPLTPVRMQLAPNGTAGAHDVPLYAHANSAFPGGFEVKLDGSANGKLVLLRMIVKSLTQHVHDVNTEISRFFSTQG